MIALYTYIFETLKNSQLANGNIFTWNNDQKEWVGADEFPQIIFQKIASNMSNNAVGVRTEVWQISVWAKSLLEAEAMTENIITLFNRTPRNTIFTSVELMHTAQSYDSDTRTHGVHSQFRFVIYNPRI